MVFGIGDVLQGAQIIGGFMRNDQARSSAHEQIDFQREMANTAHQREVADLRAAGLNPILSATKGFSGAPSPMGARYEPANPFEGSVSSAAEVQRVSPEVKKLEAEIELLKQRRDIGEPAATGAGLVNSGLTSMKGFADAIGSGVGEAVIKLEGLGGQSAYKLDQIQRGDAAGAVSGKSGTLLESLQRRFSDVVDRYSPRSSAGAEAVKPSVPYRYSDEAYRRKQDEDKSSREGWRFRAPYSQERPYRGR
ncbi:MAG: DNA pilot protein [Microvirus sp.]|nr:MAG: DNA pilot protein [Microvirus sp.]